MFLFHVGDPLLMCSLPPAGLLAGSLNMQTGRRTNRENTPSISIQIISYLKREFHKSFRTGSTAGLLQINLGHA